MAAAAAAATLRGHDPEYEAVAGVHRSVRGRAKCLAAKVAIGTLLAVSCFLMAVTRYPRYSRVSPLEEIQAYQSTSQCKRQMSLDGCKKEAWSCESDDGTQQWQCCCNDEIWKWEIPAKKASSSSPVLPSYTKTEEDAGAARVFRLEKSTDLCLGGPDDHHPGLSFATCGKPSTRFMLPISGHGLVQVASDPGLCLGVMGESRHLEITQCIPGSPGEQFQLTNGNKGMLQWSHSGDKCLDSEDGKMEDGSPVVLAACEYWPLKPSQTFILDIAPPEPIEEEEEEKDDKDEDEESSKSDKNKRRKPVLEPPSLFCISLMLPRSYEVGMLQAQLAKGVGIFDCDEWAVYSNESVKLRSKAHGNDAVFTEVINGSLWAPIGGAFHTALNTPIFRRLWKSVIKSVQAWRNDWIAKLDPDCVFFPGRLKQLLRAEWVPKGTAKWAAWLNNCQLGLHGPIEVFNSHALGVYNNKMDECDEVAENHGQEDVFMGHCFKKIGVGEVKAYNLMLESEWACNERPSAEELLPPCFARQVAFHPFKTVKSYMFCYERANRMSWDSPWSVNSAEPGPENHHHT